MAFDLDNVYSFGTGKLQDITILDGATDKLNSYARVESVGAYNIKINLDTVLEGNFEKFEAGTDILIHVSASMNATQKLGKYLVAKILNVSGDTMTLDKDFSTVITNSDLDYYFVQAVTFANLDCLTLGQGGIVTPPVYSPYHFHGGILALKCWDTLRFSGGQISLANAGIPVNRRNSLRPLVTDEPFLDASRFMLNAGHGAAFIVAKNVDLQSAPCFDVRDNTSIIFAAENISTDLPLLYKLFPRGNTTPDNAKGKTSFYLANDVYGSDTISDKFKLREVRGLKSFGRGLYDVTNPNYSLNNFAKIVWQDAQRIKYKDKTVRGLQALQTGSLVFGKNFSRVLKDSDNVLTLDKQVDKLVSVAEFKNLTLNQSYKDKYFCVTCTDTCNLNGAKIIAEEIVICAKNLNLDNATLTADKILIVAENLTGDANFECAEKFVYN